MTTVQMNTNLKKIKSESALYLYRQILLRHHPVHLLVDHPLARHHPAHRIYLKRAIILHQKKERRENEINNSGKIIRGKL